MAKQYLGTKLQDLGNFEVLDPTDRILVIKPNDEGIMALSEFLLYVKANLDFSNYLTAKQVNDTFATKVDTYTKAAADAKFAFVDKTYTRSQTDAKFAVRADTFTKDEALGLFASTNNIYLKEEVYNKEEALHAFALKSEIPVLPDLSPYSTTAKGDLRWALKTDVYAKTESDVRYPLAVNTYSKSDSDVRFAKAANTYTKDEVEAKFLDNNEAYTKSYIDQSIYLKSQVYTKLETDAKFQLKSETYTISDVNSQFAAKSWVYSRGEAELTFAPKADTYTKTEVNTLTDTKVAALAKNLNDNYYNKSVSDARYTPVGTSYSKTETDTKYPVKGQTATSISLNPTSLIYTMVDGSSNSVAVPTWNQSTTGNAATATKLQTARMINGVAFDGTTNITTPAYNSVYTLDNRTLKPADIPSRTVTAAFSTQVGMNGAAAGVDYLDVLALNTWDNNSGGYVNALVFNKMASQGIYHYIGGVGANAWTAYKQLAYTDSSITGNAATATKMQTPRSIGITGAVTGAGVNFDGTSNIAINTTAVDASKLTGIVPNASLNGVYKNVTLDISNGTIYSLKNPGDNNSVTAYGLGSIRAVGTTQNSVIVIKTNIPKGSVNVLSLHIKGLSDSETTNIDITISGWIQGNISKLSLGTKDYDVRKAQSSDGYACFIISHPSGYLGTSTAFSIATAHLNFGVDVSTLNNWSIFETTDLSTFTNISQPAAQSTSIASTYWTNVQNKPTTIAGYAITDAYTKADVYTKAEADGKYALLTNVYNKTEIDGKISTIDQIINTVTLSTTNLVFTRKNGATINLAIPTWNQSTTGNAATATQLQTVRNIAMTGDGNWAVNFDGTANVTASFTLANSGVTAGTYPKVTVDAKGRVTSGTGLAAGDIPSIDMSKVTTGILPVAQGGTGSSNAGIARNNLGLGSASIYNVGISAGQIRTNDMMVDISNAWNSSADGDKFTTNIPTNGNIFTPVAFGNVGTLDYGSGMAKRYIFDNSEYVMGWSHGLFNGYMYRFYAKRDTSTNKWTQYTAVVLDTFNSSTTNVQFNTVKIVSPATTTALPNTFIEPSTGEIKKSTTSFGPLATASVVPVANGGTGATDAAGARNNLGLGNAATLNYLPSPTTISTGGHLLRSGDYGLGYSTQQVNTDGDLDIKYSGFSGFYGVNGIHAVLNVAYSSDWVWQLQSSPNMDVGQVPKFRYFYGGTNWSSWYKFAVQGIAAKFPYLEITNAYTTTALPNVFIEPSGEIRRSTTNFGTAATRNVGTSNGDVMTVGSFGIGGGNSILVDNTSVATILSSTDGKTGVYRADTSANTSFNWMPFLYMHTGDTHTVFGAQHQNEGVRVITWSDTTINTPVVRNLYSDKSTIIYNTTIDQPANVYITPEGTLKRATRVIYDASSLNGTINNNNLNGTYNGFNLELKGNRTIYTNNSNGKTVFGLADFQVRGDVTGYIVFKTTIPGSRNTMLQLYISGMVYSEGIFDTIIKNYQYSNNLYISPNRVSRGTIDIPVRYGVTPDGYICVIVGEKDKYWYFPHISITHALVSNDSDVNYLKGWTSYNINDLTGYTLVTVPFANDVSVAKVTWDNVANRATTRDGYGITDVYTKAETIANYYDKSTSDGRFLPINNSGRITTINALDVFFTNSNNSPWVSWVNGATGYRDLSIVPSDTLINFYSRNAGDTAVSLTFNFDKSKIWHSAYGNLHDYFAKAVDVYSKGATDARYAFASNVYSKTETDTKYVKYGDSANFTLSGRVQTNNSLVVRDIIVWNREWPQQAGIRFYHDDNYGIQIYYSQIGNSRGINGSIKNIAGEYVTDWAMHFSSENGAGRGWMFETNGYYGGTVNSIAAEIDYLGRARFAQSVKAPSAIVENVRNSNPISFYSASESSAQRIMTGGVLASSDYSHISRVPNAGIYSLGDIATNNNLKFSRSLTGIRWDMNGDYARIYFKNDSDADSNSYLAFEVGDNGDEYFKWLTSNDNNATKADWMNLRSTGLTVNGNINTTGNIYTNVTFTSSIQNTETISLLNAGSALGMNMGSLLVSSAYAHRIYVPPDGIWSYGNIVSNGQIVANAGFRFPNSTWNPVGDDAFIGDFDRAGCLCIKAQNTTTKAGIAFFDNAGTELTKLWSRTSDIYIEKGLVVENIVYAKGFNSPDVRALPASSTAIGAMQSYFTTYGGLANASAGGAYGDFLSINTYRDASAGKQNGLFFDKSEVRIYHFQTTFNNAGGWGAGRKLAYLDETVNTAGGTINSGYIRINGGGNPYVPAPLVITGSGIQSWGIIKITANTDDTGVTEPVVITSGKGHDPAPNQGFSIYPNEINVFGSGNTWTSGGYLTVSNSITANLGIGAQYIGINNTDSASGKGISLYGGAAAGVPSYGLMFAGTGTFGTHGGVSGDWATYFTMTNGAQRGWIFRNLDYGNVASISSLGIADFAGTVTANGLRTTDIVISSTANIASGTVSGNLTVPDQSIISADGLAVNTRTANTKIRHALDYSPATAAAWINFSYMYDSTAGTNVITVKSSYNISNITRIGTGIYKVEFLRAFENEHFVMAGFARDDDGGGDVVIGQQSNQVFTSTTAVFSVASGSGNKMPTSPVCTVLFFGKRYGGAWLL